MEKNYFTGDQAKSPTFTAKKILRDILKEEFPIAQWVVWEELLEEEPRRGILASVRAKTVTQRSVPLAPGKIGRELHIGCEFRLVAKAIDDGTMYNADKPSELNLLSDQLQSWMFDASHGNADVPQGEDTSYPNIRKQLEDQGIYKFDLGDVKLNTDVDFTQLSFQQFSIKVYVERGRT